MSDEQPKTKKHEALLKRIRERYRYASEQWRDIRDEAKVDMRYIMGDPWEEDERRARREAGRPCISLDELGQYTNQAINNLRQSPRGIKVNPSGNGATDKTAELHENKIRAIEYDSNAQRGAYIPAFENAVQRSYGFWRVQRQFKRKSFDQKIVIKGIINPDTVLFDPDAKEADWADARYVFVHDILARDDFKQKYPQATVTDFSAVDMELAPDWIREDHVVTAEYWEAQSETRTLLLLSDPIVGQLAVYEDEVEKLTPIPPQLEPRQELKRRECEERRIVQYITNGIEILETNPEPDGCELLPIIACIGKELYVDTGAGAKRHILSLIRLARDPQMLYAYLCSQEAEEAGLTPKTPFIGYKGQFESDKDHWETVHKQPYPYLEADPVLDQTGTAVLPLPQRQPFVPNFSTYEVAKESARRAIQAAMGIANLPTAAQRRNQKSGVALERIEQQQSLGAFHFTDNYDRALELTGRVIEERMRAVYDTAREEGIRKADGTHQMVKLNTATPYQHEGEEHHYPMGTGDHGICITTAPSYQSQHDEVAGFIDTLASSAPQLFALVADLAVRIRNLGPQGDEIADRLTPPQFAKPGNPQQLAAQVAQLQQQLQMAGEELKKLQAEKQGKVIEAQGRVQVEQVRAEKDVQLERLATEVKVLVAEITTKAQKEAERDALFADVAKQLQVFAHERGLQAADHAHEKALAAQNAAHAQDAATQQAALSPPEAAQ